MHGTAPCRRQTHVPSVDFAFWKYILAATPCVLEWHAAALFLCLAESSWPTKGCPQRVFWPQGGGGELSDIWLTWTFIQLLEMHFNAFQPQRITEPGAACFFGWHSSYTMFDPGKLHPP